eukprot:5523141-Amphidinium_carterae.1
MGMPSVRTAPDPFDYMSQPAPPMGLPPVRPAQDPFDYRIPPPPSHQPPLQVQNNWNDCNLCTGAVTGHQHHQHHHHQMVGPQQHSREA